MFNFDSVSFCDVRWDWYGNRDPRPTSLTLATDGTSFFVTCSSKRKWEEYLNNGKILVVPLPEELRGLPAEKLAYYQEVLLPLLKAAREKSVTKPSAVA